MGRGLTVAGAAAGSVLLIGGQTSPSALLIAGQPSLIPLKGIPAGPGPGTLSLTSGPALQLQLSGIPAGTGPGALGLNKLPMNLALSGVAATGDVGALDIENQRQVSSDGVGLLFPQPDTISEQDPIQVSRSDHRLGAVHQRIRDEFVPTVYRCVWGNANNAAKAALKQHHQTQFTEEWTLTLPRSAGTVPVAYVGEPTYQRLRGGRYRMECTLQRTRG